MSQRKEKLVSDNKLITQLKLKRIINGHENLELVSYFSTKNSQFVKQKCVFFLKK